MTLTGGRPDNWTAVSTECLSLIESLTTKLSTEVSLQVHLQQPPLDPKLLGPVLTNGHANGHANGHVNGQAGLKKTSVLFRFFLHSKFYLLKLPVHTFTKFPKNFDLEEAKTQRQPMKVLFYSFHLNGHS